MATASASPLSDDEQSEDEGAEIMHNDQQDDVQEEESDEDEEGDVGTPSPARGRGRGGVRGRGRGGTRGGARGGRKNRAEWVHNTGINITMPPFAAAEAGPVLPPTPPEHTVDLFLTPDVVEMVRSETTRRGYFELATRTPPPRLLDGWQALAAADVYGFFAIIIIMGIHDLPCEEDYWSTDDVLGVKCVRTLMPYARFKAIKHCLMVANPSAEQNAADKLAKVRPFINITKGIIRARYKAQQDLSLDESQCQCGHRYSRISYRGETKKPIADYIKIISLHCAHCGYCLDFTVDTRTQTTRDMVLDVCSALPHQPYRIATDRFYTSVDTAKALLERGLYMYGTVRTDRGIDPELRASLSSSQLTDGESRWSMAPPSLLCCVWRDTTKDGVWFLSTCHDGREGEGEVQRRSRGQPTVTKAAPVVAIDYNKYMGGCDRANSLRQSYNM